jgi:L-ribulose-5-phosphate 3-epimerase
MEKAINRRQFVSMATSIGVAAALPSALAASTPHKESWFDISVAQWSFQKFFYSGEMKTAAFPQFCVEKLGIYGIDYLSDFMLDIYRKPAELREIKKRSDDLAVKNLMIMCHKEGRVGDINPREREKVIERHYHWVEAASHLGCSAIRVNARSGGSREQQLDLVVDSLKRLCEFAKPYGVNVIVENLWGGDFSYKADFIADVMKTVDHPHCGTLPDLNNFRYDNPYDSVEKIMPWAKAVSAKSIDFDPKGREKYIDYQRMIDIVYASGFRGHIGIEWEGCKKPALQGVLLTKALLEKTREVAALPNR